MLNKFSNSCEENANSARCSVIKVIVAVYVQDSVDVMYLEHQKLHGNAT